MIQAAQAPELQKRISRFRGFKLLTPGAADMAEASLIRGLG